MKKCGTKHCRNKALKARTICSKCQMRIFAERHPEKYAFNNLKQNAKRRGKVFELTFEQFQQFAIESEYMAGKGITKNGLHIDRIDPEKGYLIENIRVLTNSENVKRHQRYLKHGFDESGIPESFHVECKQNDGHHGDVPF